MNDKVVHLSAPITMTHEPNEVATIVFALKKLPYENVAALLEKFQAACQPKPAGKKK